ncbi:nuclear pore complex component [Calycina marina]|uniref:Nuclear pore complex component n=1 Tax=Calycina marina TaxID=1763456 RepID=A0A9P8CDD4_9HELO|nr:nuclear pore complex component [Calycina marina]
MSTPNRPSTPVAQAASTPTGGSWRHPRMDEISRRQQTASFTDRNVKKASWNVLGIVLLWYIETTLRSSFPKVLKEGSLSSYVTYFCYGLVLILGYNTYLAVSPAMRTPDDLSDIPLTPAQRKLLGLPPTSKPPTPGSQYSTPPRIARTPTPSASPINMMESFSNSPRSGNPKSGSVSGSPFSPGQSSYVQKAVGGAGFDGSRRQSYGSPSPLGPAGSRGNISIMEMPSTPTPLASKGTSVGLNNRWLYEKGRRNSGNAKILGS